MFHHSTTQKQPPCAARSLFPCQDSPGVKFTYNATVQVPEWATALMSAISLSNDTVVEGAASFRKFTFEQKAPIPAYLLALAVGCLEARDLSERCRSRPSDHC